MIEFSEVSYSYPSKSDTKIIDNISFCISYGQEVSIMGICGCGKSTLLKLMCGLIKPDSGQIKILGQDLSNISKKERYKIFNNIGVAFQQGGLFAAMNVKDNLMFAIKNMKGWSEDECEKIIDEYLRKVNLFHAKYLFPNELSGGMKRRVAIIRALCTKPNIVLLDNPTAGLDPLSSHQIISMINLINQQSDDDTSIICFTSNIEVGITLASRIILLHNAKIEQDGKWQDLIFTGSEWSKKILTAKFVKHSDQYLENIGFPASYIQSR